MYGVVIVEDEELERKALRSILTENFECIHTIHEAATGKEAQHLIDTCDIALMLVDIKIPKPNGMEVIRYLRQKQPETKVIIITAYDHFELTRAAIVLNVDEYLLKPIRPQELVQTVSKNIQQLGSGMRCRALSRQLGALLEEGGYRRGIELVHSYLEWFYAQRETPARRLLLDLSDALTDLAREKHLLSTAEILPKQAEKLLSIPLDDHNRHEIYVLFHNMTDCLFDSAVIQFGSPKDTMQRVMNFIERNLRKGVTLKETADNANISVCYLSRLFKKTFNVNFITYITGRRMEIASKLLLNTQLPVANIALDLSYSDVNYFCKVFKKEIGLSPARFRRQNMTEDKY